MKVLFISNLYPSCKNPWAGMFHVPVFNLLRNRCDIRILKANMTPLWTPTKRVIEDDKDNPSVTSIPVSYVPKCGVLNGWLFAKSIRREFRHIVATEKTDVVLSSWMYPDAYGTMLLCRQERLPYVCDAIGSDVNRFLDFPVRRRQVIRVARNAKAVVVRSNALKTKLVDAGIDPGKITLLYNGVDHSLFRPLDRAACRKQLAIPENEKWIVFLGGFVPVKNVGTLLQALRLLQPRFQSPVRLFLGGYGHQKAQLQETARSLGLASVAQFSDQPIARSEVPVWINAADVICLPSLNEGVPNIILESLACGVPVVASRVGGIPEVLPSTAGILVTNPTDANELADALAQSLHDSWNRTAICQVAARFTWEATAETMFQVLTHAAKN